MPLVFTSPFSVTPRAGLWHLQRHSSGQARRCRRRRCLRRDACLQTFLDVNVHRQGSLRESPSRLPPNAEGKPRHCQAGGLVWHPQSR